MISATSSATGISAPTPPCDRPLDRLLSALEARGCAPKHNGAGLAARCPGHDDARASLSVSEGSDGRALIHCHAGCTAEAIVEALGLRLADLFPPRPRAKNAKPRIVAAYPYRDEGGTLLFQVLRYEPKAFRQRRPAGDDEWTWRLDGTRRVLYRLPETIAAVQAGETIYLTEGERDVLTGVKLALAATCNSGGVGKWRPEYSETLRDADVVILPDADEPGRMHAEQVARSLHGVAARVRVVELPGAKDLSEWIKRGGTREKLDEIVAAAPTWEPAIEAGPERSTGLPTIYTTDRPMRHVTTDALAALRRANDPPVLFARGGELVRVRQDEKGRPIIQSVDDSMLRGYMDRSANFAQLRGRKEIVTVPVPPPLDNVRDLRALPSLGLPGIEAVVEVPVLRPDGTVMDRPGHDEATGLYYAPAPGLRVSPVPTLPDRAAVARALALLRESIEGFPFSDEASRANALALMLTPIVRPAIRGRVPIGLVDAPQLGTGKSLLAELVGMNTCGRGAAMMTAPAREEEWKKSITALLVDGATHITIDNVEGTLVSASLASAVTATTWRDRLLGLHKTVTVPQHAAFIVTGNNIRLGGDLMRRCYWIRLDAKTSRPWKRSGFRHEDLLGWAQENRGEMVGALLTLARAWFAAGQPRAKVPRVGGFQEWTSLVGSILAFAGTEGFLGNLEAMYDQADEGLLQWEGFLRAWGRVYGASPRTVAEVASDLASTRTSAGTSAPAGGDPADVRAAADVLRDALPHDLLDALGDKQSGRSFSTRLGKALSKRKDVCFGDDGIHLAAVGRDPRGKGTLWRVLTPADVADVGCSSTREKNERGFV